MQPKDLERVIVDTTVQEKAIAHPVDSRLLEIARHKVVSAAKRVGISLKQTYAKEGKALRRRAAGYAHAKQFRRLHHRLDRCWLKGAIGDALHAIICAAGYNLRWLLRAVARLGISPIFLRLLQALLRLTKPPLASYSTYSTQ